MAYFRCEKTSKMLKKLIWTNPSPTTAFPAQTLLLDLTQYDAVIIRVSCGTNYNTDAQKPYQTFNYIPKDGESHYLHSLLNTSGTSNAYWGRVVSVTNSGITFSTSGYPVSTLANNNATQMIPTEIYGYVYQPELVTSEQCNHLINASVDAGQGKTSTYTATKQATLIITMSSRSISAYSVTKNGTAVQPLTPASTQGSSGVSYCFSVNVESGDTVVAGFTAGTGTYSTGYLNILEIPSVIINS